MAKVVRKSNFDHEDYRGDQYFVAQRLGELEAKAVAEALNNLGGPHSEDYYEPVADDYVLPPDWEP